MDTLDLRGQRATRGSSLPRPRPLRTLAAVRTIARMNTSASWIVVDENGDPLPLHCAHLDELQPVESPPPRQCVDCLREGSTWVHLRQCLTCGLVRCCDNSPRRHASAHGRSSGHPVIRSAEPDEAWGWCYPEELLMVPAEAG
jgi:hypothetical protein